MVSPANLGDHPEVHNTAFLPSAVGTTGFHGFLIRPPTNATSVLTPNAPRPIPSETPIILRRLIVEPSSASERFATAVFRWISGDAPSWRSWMLISSGMNFFWYSTAPMPMARIESPNVSPYSGVARSYHQWPSVSLPLYSHGQNRKISSSARPKRPPSRSQLVTERAARFSALVSLTGQRSSL